MSSDTTAEIISISLRSEDQKEKWREHSQKYGGMSKMVREVVNPAVNLFEEGKSRHEIFAGDTSTEEDLQETVYELKEENERLEKKVEKYQRQLSKLGVSNSGEKVNLGFVLSECLQEWRTLDQVMRWLRREGYSPEGFGLESNRSDTLTSNRKAPPTDPWEEMRQVVLDTIAGMIESRYVEVKTGGKTKYRARR